MRQNRLSAVLATLCLALLLAGALAQAAITVTDKKSDVRSTKHNLSAAATGTATPTGTVPARTIRATDETQVCVFCHTPHGAETPADVKGPLWNRKLSGATYSAYDSTSMEATPGAPGGSSKLCLSCHDGTMGIDKVNVLNGVQTTTTPVFQVAIPMSGGTTMPASADGVNAGFTRNLGTDLSNDHPISFTYDGTLAGHDGELRTPDGVIVGNRQSGVTPPKLPLESDQMQCATCHDPHLSDQNKNNGNAKFLRLNRFQVDQPSGGAFSPANDIICLACHDKGGGAWAFSAHANKGVATQVYKAAAAQKREFPSSLDVPANTEPAVWQVACLNCHDTHTTAGARRLLREGSASTKPAMEQTCYQCHTTAAEAAVTFPVNDITTVPNIKSDFALLRSMPITATDPATGQEAHNIGGTFSDGYSNCGKTTGKCGKDTVEARANLGLGDLGRRHAECSDCHNPHRVIKAQNGLPGTLSALNTKDAVGTHKHVAGTAHTNIISGVLRGTFGVEPVYTDPSFHVMPSSFNVKRGDPGSNTLTDAARPYVTREYQICLKCHSNYGYQDDNVYPNSAVRPQLGAACASPPCAGPTPRNSNGHTTFTSFTNQAKEFQAPATHAVAVGTVSRGIEGGANVNTNNYRSWHPVMAPTGRVGRLGNWLAPWNTGLGTQTMMCSDCHGSATPTDTSVSTNNGVVPTGGEYGNP